MEYRPLRLTDQGEEEERARAGSGVRILRASLLLWRLWLLLEEAAEEFEPRRHQMTVQQGHPGSCLEGNKCGGRKVTAVTQVRVLGWGMVLGRNVKGPIELS